MAFRVNAYLLRSETAVFVDGKRQETRDELTAYCQQAGLRLRLHQYTGGWRMVLRGTNGSRSYPKLVLKRDQCHWGVCKRNTLFPIWNSALRAVLKRRDNAPSAGIRVTDQRDSARPADRRKHRNSAKS